MSEEQNAVEETPPQLTEDQQKAAIVQQGQDCVRRMINSDNACKSLLQEYAENARAAKKKRINTQAALFQHLYTLGDAIHEHQAMVNAALATRMSALEETTSALMKVLVKRQVFENEEQFEECFTQCLEEWRTELKERQEERIAYLREKVEVEKAAASEEEVDAAVDAAISASTPCEEEPEEEGKIIQI